MFAIRAGTNGFRGGRLTAAAISQCLMHTSPCLRFPVDVDSYHYDVALTDINTKKLASNFAPRLGVTYLGPATVAADYAERWPLKGVYSSVPSRRMLLNVPVQLNSKCINVIFLLASGAPFTYVATEALEALGMTDYLPPDLQVHLNGLPFEVRAVPADSHFQGVSLLGADFLEDIDANVVSNRAARTFELHPGKHAVPAALR